MPDSRGLETFRECIDLLKREIYNLKKSRPRLVKIIRIIERTKKSFNKKLPNKKTTCSIEKLFVRSGLLSYPEKDYAGQGYKIRYYLRLMALRLGAPFLESVFKETRWRDFKSYYDEFEINSKYLTQNILHTSETIILLKKDIKIDHILHLNNYAKNSLHYLDIIISDLDRCLDIIDNPKTEKKLRFLHEIGDLGIPLTDDFIDLFVNSFDKGDPLWRDRSKPELIGIIKMFHDMGLIKKENWNDVEFILKYSKGREKFTHEFFKYIHGPLDYQKKVYQFFVTSGVHECFLSRDTPPEEIFHYFDYFRKCIILIETRKLDTIWAIRRGGIPLGAMLKKISIQILPNKVDFRITDKPFFREKIEFSEQDYKSVKGRRILLVDEYVSTGKTFDLVKSKLFKLGAECVEPGIFAGECPRSWNGGWEKIFSISHKYDNVGFNFNNDTDFSKWLVKNRPFYKKMADIIADYIKR